MAGLHDICPMRDGSSETSAVDAPSRDAAHAASAPACPPPITMMSYSVFTPQSYAAPAGFCRAGPAHLLRVLPAEHHRQLLDLVFVALESGQVEIAFQLLAALLKDQRLGGHDVHGHVRESEGRFIAPKQLHIPRHHSSKTKNVCP